MINGIEKNFTLDELKELDTCPGCGAHWPTLKECIKEGTGENCCIALYIIDNCQTCRKRFSKVAGML